MTEYPVSHARRPLQASEPKLECLAAQLPSKQIEGVVKACWLETLSSACLPPPAAEHNRKLGATRPYIIDYYIGMAVIARRGSTPPHLHPALHLLDYTVTAGECMLRPT